MVELICGIGTAVAFYSEPYVYEVDGLQVYDNTATVRLKRLSDGFRVTTQLSGLIAVYGSEYDVDTGMIVFFDNKKVKEAMSNRENLLSYCMKFVEPFEKV